MITLSVIKADIGGYVGHSSSHPDILGMAQKWLEINLPGVEVAEADTFYGYYTLHTLKGDQLEGMLSR